MSKLLFNNSIGKIYDDKIVIEKEKYDYGRILAMRVTEQRNNSINILFAVFAVLFLLIARFSLTNMLYFYGSLILCTISALVAALFNKKDYFFFLSLTVGTELEVKTKSKNEEEARTFLKIASENKQKFR